MGLCVLFPQIVSIVATINGMPSSLPVLSSRQGYDFLIDIMILQLEVKIALEY